MYHHALFRCAGSHFMFTHASTVLKKWRLKPISEWNFIWAAGHDHFQAEARVCPRMGLGMGTSLSLPTHTLQSRAEELVSFALCIKFRFGTSLNKPFVVV